MLDSSIHRRMFAKFGLAFAATAATRGAFAQDPYPNRPMHILVPFAPGGSTDALARLLGKGLSERLGQPVVIDNRPGAGGNIAMGAAARSAPDGYTLIVVSSSLVINPALYASVPFNAKTSFAPITYLAAAPSLLVVNPKLGVNTVRKLVDDTKARPNRFYYTSPGVGTAQHLAGELFRQATGTTLTHVPFSGAGPAVLAVVSGEAQTGFSSLPAALPLVKAGSLRALAITTTTRSPAAPDIPTFAEEGYGAVQADHMQGLLAPASTPPDIIDKLSAATLAALKDPQIARQLVDLGFIVGGGSPESFAQEIDRQLANWRTVIKSAHISVG